MSSLLERYKAFVRGHSDLLSVIETAVSSLTWVLPDRFAESELTLEVIHTAVNLASSFHDTITRQAQGPAPPGSDLVLLLGALQQVQVLVELGAIRAEQRGKLASRYDAVALVEGIKALVRMAILHYSGSRLLLHGGHTNCLTSWAGKGVSSAGSSSSSSSSGSTQQVFEAFARFRTKHCQTGAKAMAQPSSSDDASKQQSVRPQQSFSAGGTAVDAAASAGNGSDVQSTLWWEASAKPPAEGGTGSSTGLRELEARCAAKQTAAMRLIIAGELLHILRPLVHALALRRWGRASWRPWLISLGMDLLSHRCTALGARLSQSSAASGAQHPAVKGTSLALLFSLQAIRWGPGESEELTRRKLQLLYYLLRDPLFSTHVHPALERWQQAVGWVPLLGSLSQKATDILSGLQAYFSYTSCS